MSVNFRIQTEIQRPDPSLVASFKGIPVANIADCMNRMSCLDSYMMPVNSAPLLGTAFTVKTTGGDNLLVHKALDMASPGDVIVVADGSTNRSTLGEIIVSYARARGLAGFVIDGCIRDRDAIKNMDIPVYCKGFTPNGPYKNGPGEINFPVACAGQVIFPGDILVGDGDGVVVIRPHEAESILRQALAVVEKETKMLEDILSGKPTDRTWVDKRLAELNVSYE